MVQALLSSSFTEYLEGQSDGPQISRKGTKAQLCSLEGVLIFDYQHRGSWVAARVSRAVGRTYVRRGSH